MSTLRLPSNCYTADVIRGLSEIDALTDPDAAVVIHFPPGCFVHTAALAFLCAWGRWQVRQGRRIQLRGDADTLAYVARMDLHKHLELDYKEVRRRSEKGRFLPLCLITKAEDTVPVREAVRDLLVHQFDDVDKFLRSGLWAVNEMLDNILLHSGTSEAGAVCAQYFPAKHRLDLGVADVGRGIMASLGESMPLWGHGQAVTTALRRGVTRDLEVGQGNGLAGTREIVRLNGGDFRLWTGDVIYRLSGGAELGFESIPEVPGTGVMFSLDTRRPVDLSQTWMAKFEGASYLKPAASASGGGQDPYGGAGHSPRMLNSLPVQRVLAVRRECGGASTRGAARGLREKASELLEGSSSSLAFDFADMEVTSSFLDELFGRLAREIGVDVFRERVRVQNLSSEDEGLANVAIVQRLEGAS